MNLGARIKRRREQLGYTQQYVAAAVSELRVDKAELSQQALGLLERRDSMKSNFVYELAAVLKTNVTWLMKGTGDPDATEDQPKVSALARYIGENFDKLPPIRQELVREIFSNWGEGPEPPAAVEKPEQQEDRVAQHVEDTTQS